MGGVAQVLPDRVGVGWGLPYSRKIPPKAGFFGEIRLEMPGKCIKIASAGPRAPDFFAPAARASESARTEQIHSRTVTHYYQCRSSHPSPTQTITNVVVSTKIQLNIILVFGPPELVQTYL